ncbi:glycosyltransferase family 2 protein [Pedobacter mendelii]|uniref:Glycosyltransferase 2-like domain-containing protein n=1 Tax=Pedobacter mendelii TaxID=1908240 RepID=A0ABQ2BP78_9SPHI|nr:glycosyltransferase family 2 protein [Pedobacter mendelii]GGI28217.1 hypothetical protein GCM10008119_31540 [Pedobacter mendelii]
MIKPLVSIIIPTYNYAHLITETLESVLNQTYDNWECIVIDDGSTDNTEEVIEDFIKHHSTYSFIYIKKVNEGTSVAKNTGISLAAGKYIQFLDADDLISPEKLAIQVKLLLDINCSLVFSKSVYFNSNDSLRLPFQKWPKGFLIEESIEGYQLMKKIITNNILTISSPLVSAEFIKQNHFVVSLRNNEDWLFWFNAALKLEKFVFDHNEHSVTYIRLHDVSAVNNKAKMFQGEVIVRNIINQILEENNLAKDKIALAKLNLDLLALHQIRSSNVSAGMKYILSSFVKNPSGEFKLFTKALFKLGVRVYKSVIS